jgi:transporter family-2 protein
VSRGTPVAIAAAVASGALVAVQQQINGDLGVSLDDALLAAVVSFLTGLLVVAAVVGSRRAARARVPLLRAVPWPVRLGGLGGATLVAVGATAAPRTGVALLTVGLVAGSTVGGLVVDRLGLGPAGSHPLSAFRLAGAGLSLAAILLAAHEGLNVASPLLLGLVVLAGGLISVQQALNGRVRQATDASVATLLNFVVGTTALLLALGVHAAVSGVSAVSWPGPDRWWLYLGGPMGATFVAVAAVVVRRLGVLRLGLAVTAGQVVGGLLLDLDRGVAWTTVAAACLTILAVSLTGLATPVRPSRRGQPKEQWV